MTLRASNRILRLVLPMASELRRGFHEISGEDGREELDGLVGAKEPLVAVEPDEELGRQVAEESEHARAVDELARVVRVVRAHSETQRHRRPDHVAGIPRLPGPAAASSGGGCALRRGF